MKLFNQMGKVKKSIAAAFVAGGVGLGLLAAIPGADVLHVFSSNEFCESCHTMGPTAHTFKDSVHGGNNDIGFVANCVDCHLPQEGGTAYMLWKKSEAGARHMFGEFVLQMDMLDYDELHPKRTEYVYDSGCLSCHKGLEDRAVKATADSSPADQTHKLVFEKRENDPDWQCASCHYDIAHPNLKNEMRAIGEQLQQELAAAEAK